MSEAKLVTTCAGLHVAGTDPDEKGRLCMGHCPACHQAVFDTDNPVWTCPANLSEGNPHQLDPTEEVSEERMQRVGAFSYCGLDHGFPCHDDMPLHGACYDGDRFTW